MLGTPVGLVGSGAYQRIPRQRPVAAAGPGMGVCEDLSYVVPGRILAGAHFGALPGAEGQVHPAHFVHTGW